MTITLPLPPNRANGRGHWSVRYRAEKEWGSRALAALYEQRGLKPDEPLGRYLLAALVVTQRPADLDNCAARLKPIIDLLVRRHWLAGDGPKQLAALTVTQETDPHSPRVEVTIEAAA